MIGCQQMALANGLGCVGRSHGNSNAAMGPLHHFRTTQLRSIRSKPVLRIGLYRVPSAQITARSNNDQQAYSQSSSSSETSYLAKIAARVLISIPIAAAILGLTPRKVHSATATADFSMVGGARQAAVMDHRTGMPHKWVYSNDNQWSHHEYDAIYKFYTEGLPPSEHTASAQVPSMRTNAAAASSTDSVKKAKVAKESSKTFSNATAPVVVVEKKKDFAVELEKITQPGKVAVLVEALNNKMEKTPAPAAATLSKPKTASIQSTVTSAPAPSLTAAAAAAVKKEASSKSSSASSSKAPFEVTSFITSANAFRVAVGQSFLAQVAEMRAFAASTATETAGRVKEMVPSNGKEKVSGSIVEMKNGISDVAGRGASAIVDGAKTIATTAAHGGTALVNGASAVANSAASMVSRGSGAVASGATQRAGVLLGKAEAFKNTLGGAVLSQASSFRNGANETLLSTKKAITAAVPSAADKKKDAKSVKETAVAIPTSKHVVSPTKPAVKPAKAIPPTKKQQAPPQQKNQQQQEKRSEVQLLAKAEAFRQTLGHAVLSQMTAFKQAAVNAKNALPTLPTLRSPGTATATATAALQKQSAKFAKSTPSKTTAAKTTTVKKPTSGGVDAKNKDSSPSSTFPSSSLQKMSDVAQGLSKDVVIMKDAILAAFVWQPSTLATAQGTPAAKKSGNGNAASAAASPIWGWAPSVVVPSTSADVKGKGPSLPEKTSWFTGNGSGTSPLWGWNPSTYFSSSSSPSSSTAATATAAAPFGWAPHNFALSSSSSAAGGVAAAQWNWIPTNFFPSSSSPTPSSSSSPSSSPNPKWSWNPINFAVAPRVALIAAGLIGCAYILGLAYQRVTTTISDDEEGKATQCLDNTATTRVTGGEAETLAGSGSNGNGKVVDSGSDLLRNASAVGATVALSESDRYSITSGKSSFSSDNSYDGEEAAAATAATTTIVGRSKEELIAESQRRINAAKEAVANAERQKAEAAAAATAAAQRVEQQQQAIADAASDWNATTASSTTSTTTSTNSAPKSQKSFGDSVADSFDMVRNLIHSAALVDDWGTPVTSKYDPLQGTIGTITSSQWELSDWAGPSKYCPVTDVLQGLSVPPASGSVSKYDPFSSGIKSMDPWTGPARDRTKTPLREEKYDMVAALFTAIMTQKEPPLRKYEKKEEIQWDPVAVALDAAAGWQPPQPRSFTTSTTGKSRNGSMEIVTTIAEADKYDLTAALMAGLYTITPPKMADGGARWDPLKYVLSGWAAEWEGTAADIRRPVSPTYDPAAGMKGAEPSRIRSKYDWAQAVLQSDAPSTTAKSNNGTVVITSSNESGGKRAWLLNTASSLKENVPKMLKWKGGQQEVQIVVQEMSGGDGVATDATVVAVVGGATEE